MKSPLRCDLFSLLFLVRCQFSSVSTLKSMNDDMLSPYKERHGPSLTNRHVRDIQSPTLGKDTYEIYDAHSSSDMLPVARTRYFISDIPLHSWYSTTSNHVYGHYTYVRNPQLTFSVIEPPSGGCHNNTTATVEETSRQRNCVVAQNGGFFRTKTGDCLGNIISDGRLLKDSSGIQNAHFGITRNGSIIVGYLSESNVKSMDFLQLIGGVVWLVRNGKSYVDESISIEEAGTEETGTLRYFSDVQSARTAIGHDKDGHIVFVQVDGQTGARGVNLPAFSKFLIEELHLVNAINLDGGGSATLVLNGTLSNYPSDHCEGAPMWRCARSVTTVICAHPPDCVPSCINGECIDGRCKCKENWHGEICSTLRCGRHNCSDHGSCSPNGCSCDAGWRGTDCSIPCDRHRYGPNCTQECYCLNNADCDSITGACSCTSGYSGKACDQRCPSGWHGRNCSYECHCGETCLCDHVTGTCEQHLNVTLHQDIANVSQCLARNLWGTSASSRREDIESSERLLIYFCIVSGCFAISLSCNILLMWNSSKKLRDSRKYASSESDTSTSSARSLEQTGDHNEIRTCWHRLLDRLYTRGQYIKLEAKTEEIEMEERSLLSAVT